MTFIFFPVFFFKKNFHLRKRWVTLQLWHHTATCCKDEKLQCFCSRFCNAEQKIWLLNFIWNLSRTYSAYSTVLQPQGARGLKLLCEKCNTRSCLDAPGDGGRNKATMINNAHLPPPPARYLHLCTRNDSPPLRGIHLWTEFLARSLKKMADWSKLKTKLFFFCLWSLPSRHFWMF